MKPELYVDRLQQCSMPAHMCRGHSLSNFWLFVGRKNNGFRVSSRDLKWFEPWITWMVILEYLLGHHIFHQHQNFGLPALCLLYVCLTYHRVKTGNYTRLNHGSPKQNRCLICKCCKRCSLDLRQTYPLTSARASCFAKQSKLFNFSSAETFARTSWHRQQVSGSTTNCAIVPKIR